MLEERRHPTKEDLDRVSTELPVWAVHASRQMAVGNSVALDQAGIAAATPDPEGGASEDRPSAAGSREPTGLLQEAAWAHVRLTLLPTVPEHHHPDLIRRTGDALRPLRDHHRAGRRDATSAACRCCTRRPTTASLPIDVVAYPL